MSIHVVLYVVYAGDIMPLYPYSMKIKPNCTEYSLNTIQDQHYVLSDFAQIMHNIFISGQLLPNEVWVWLLCPTKFY